MNQQYCDYLNSANSENLIMVDGSGVVYPIGGGNAYCDTTGSSSYSRITWDGNNFGVVSGEENHPMVMVNWYGAVAYCDYYGYRLPTEAEWEYAARGGLSGKRFPWGNTISHSQANYRAYDGYPYDLSDSNGYHPEWDDGIHPYTAPLGRAGNVWEWCNDWWDPDYYSTSPYDNPTGPASGIYRGLRGGCWNDSAYDCRVAYRNINAPEYRGFVYGFRVVRSAEPPCVASFQGLGDLDGGAFASEAYDVSADGLVVVGRSQSALGWEAFRWTESTGMVGLASLPSDSSSMATGVSNNGSVVIGYSSLGVDDEAFRWTLTNPHTGEGTMVGLGLLPSHPSSIAIGVSADGSAVVGAGHRPGVGPGTQAFLWTETAGMVPLEDLPADGIFSNGYGFSGDGAMVV
ncbi:MAG: SUMF1/EgtB/PvdO family nonheme iron enzyme, partial [Planctomycetota bacterium]